MIHYNRAALNEFSRVLQLPPISFSIRLYGILVYFYTSGQDKLKEESIMRERSPVKPYFAATLTLAFFLTVLPAYSCCSLAPAKFSETKGYAGEGHKDGKLVHLLAYQNTAVNHNTTGGGGNAMFLPIPAIPGTMNEKNILDTSKFPDFLLDMRRAAFPPSKATRSESTLRMATPTAAPIVFNSDIYTIVLAQNAKDIPAALSRVPVSRRPHMNKEIFDAYAKWYPGWTFALCCFNNKEASKAKPMLWWYEPNDKTTLFFPALDAHNGKAPVLNSQVGVEHDLIFSAEGLPKEITTHEVHYRNFPGGRTPDSLTGLLPKKIMGERFRGNMPQGDFSVNLSTLRSGKFQVERILPPGAERNSNNQQ
jgi:hypothetical protein